MIVRLHPDAPEGCRMRPMTGRLLKLIWRIQTDARRQLLQLIDSFRGQARIRSSSVAARAAAVRSALRMTLSSGVA
jgi:hypothetical protein